MLFAADLKKKTSLGFLILKLGKIFKVTFLFSVVIPAICVVLHVYVRNVQPACHYKNVKSVTNVIIEAFNKDFPSKCIPVRWVSGYEEKFHKCITEVNNDTHL